jgi:uncharacterized protein (DUF1778 family)
MAVPRKDPKLLMDKDLRTPVTPEQKALIQQAAEIAGLGLAPWCRQTLLRVAKEEIAHEQSRKNRFSKS